MRPKITGVVVILFAVIAALSALDRFLARVESSELHGSAQRSFEAGSRLLQTGKAGEAVDLLRQAHSGERENPDYELELISALTESGKTADAEPLMTEMLQREPNDGRVNLIAARLRKQEGNPADAEAYYHRAIYGEWRMDPARHRIAARLELVDDLMKRGRRQELLAELISLGAEPEITPAVRKRLARLFLDTGSPARAADEYRALIAKDPKDVTAAEGLGEAELEQGQYSAARAAYLQGFFQNPNDASIQMHLATLNTVVALDPTLRQLTSEEKYRRSVRILDMARTALAGCAAQNPLLAQVTGQMPAHVTNEDAEKVLALAEQIWRAGNDACGAAVNAEDALNLLMRKLAT